jgi:RNA polymerase-binding transcription factor DksA
MLLQVYKMTDISGIYNHLLKERERLNKGLEELKVKIGPTDERREGSPFGKREEEATEVMELEKRMALEKQVIDSLSKINRAIQKYEAGTYGICDQCGKQIEPGRLEALPHAALCLNCRASQTKNKKSRSTP